MSIDGFKVTAPSVLEAGEDPVTVDDRQIEELIAFARSQPNRRARLLLHPTRKDSLQEMIIALPLTSCDHPHINDLSSKSFTALSGQFAVMRFADDGTWLRPIVLSAGDWPGTRLVRLRKPTWHTIIPLQGETVFLETIVGPFTGNRFAEWFPAEDSQERAEAQERLRLHAHEAADGLSKGCAPG